MVITWGVKIALPGNLDDFPWNYSVLLVVFAKAIGLSSIVLIRSIIPVIAPLILHGTSGEVSPVAFDAAKLELVYTHPIAVHLCAICCIAPRKKCDSMRKIPDFFPLQPGDQTPLLLPPGLKILISVAVCHCHQVC